MRRRFEKKLLWKIKTTGKSAVRRWAFEIYFSSGSPRKAPLFAIVETTLSARSQSECCGKNRRQIRHEHGHSHSNASAQSSDPRAASTGQLLSQAVCIFTLVWQVGSGRVEKQSIPSLKGWRLDSSGQLFSGNQKNSPFTNNAHFSYTKHAKAPILQHDILKTHDWRQNYASDRNGSPHLHW
jgi:hypothetical protein